MKPEEIKNEVRTAQQADKIIAEFMGPFEGYLIGSNMAGTYKTPRHYSKSLDALVPVWEKLREKYRTNTAFSMCLFDYNGNPWNCEIGCDDYPPTWGVEHSSPSPFESAAVATAKAILVLEEK